jgi:predicted RNA-binding Zn ribbon-like protein
MRFEFVSDHLALDFAATVAWRGTEPVDMLTTPADLAGWITQASLVDRLAAPTRAQLDRARNLREAVYRAARAAVDGAPAAPDDLGLIRGHAARRPPVPVLDALGHLRWEGDCDQALALLAVRASELLGTPAHTAIRACAGDRCTRLYVDHSRAGTRRWCDKATCGARATSAAYRRRRGTGAGPGA